MSIWVAFTLAMLFAVSVLALAGLLVWAIWYD